MSELNSIANFTVSNNCARWSARYAVILEKTGSVSWTPTGGALTSSLYDMIAELCPHWLRCYLSWAQRIGRRLECLDHLAAAERP